MGCPIEIGPAGPVQPAPTNSAQVHCDSAGRLFEVPALLPDLGFCFWCSDADSDGNRRRFSPLVLGVCRTPDQSAAAAAAAATSLSGCASDLMHVSCASLEHSLDA